MKKTTTLTGFIILFSVAPCILLASIWKIVTAKVIHFGRGTGIPQINMGDKSKLIPATITFTIVSLCVYFILVNIYRIDPKRYDQKDSSRFTKIAVGTSVFITILNFLQVASVAKIGLIVLQHSLFPLMGLSFAFIGNYMHNIKPNYFAGLRLPWTLSDDENWRKTHLLAGKLWFWSWLAFCFVSLVVSFEMKAISSLLVNVYIFCTLTFITTIIPAVYSYRLFKHKKEMGL